MSKNTQQDEWALAKELIFESQIHDLATKSEELFTALAIIENPHTKPETLALLAGLWHASNQICEAIAGDLRTPTATLQNMAQFKFGSRAEIARETMKKQAEDFKDMRKRAVLQAAKNAERAAAHAFNAWQLAEAYGNDGKYKYAQYAQVQADGAALIPKQIEKAQTEAAIMQLLEIAKEREEYALSRLRDCEKAIF
jgi:hypothetical protein